MQLHAEVAVRVVPVGQPFVTQEEAPKVEYPLAEHARHAVGEEAPTVVEYLPGAQGVQLVSPAVEPYVPAGHGVHEATVAPPQAIKTNPFPLFEP